VFLLPALLATYSPHQNQLNLKFAASILWLAIPVSILAVQLWLYLLSDNPIKAAFWLFLCPISGFFLANMFMNEPITVYTMVGMVLVIGGLYLVLKK
jgi:drug/metabolite transporter (DMT)-like permease